MSEQITRKRYQMALCQGHGDKDKGGMILVFEDLLGVLYRSNPAG